MTIDAPPPLAPVAELDDTLLELLPVAVYVCNPDGVILRYNKRAAELWGRAPKIGETEQRFCGSHRLFLPDGRPLPHDQTPMVTALTSGASTRDQEVCIEQPNGRRITVSVNISPIRDTAGRIVGAVNCFQDITERKVTDQRLQESQALLEAVFETTPECIKVVARDGALLQMNRAGLSMIEAPSADEVRGACIFDLIAPEDREAWRQNHQRVCDGETLSWEFEVVGLAGARRQMETHAAPLTFGGETSQLAITRDITERKRQEARVRASESRARELLEAMPTAIYTTDAEGRLTFYNEAAAAFWGRRPELGTTKWCGSWRLYTPAGEPLPFEECPMAVALRERRPIRNVEAIAERPDGVRVPFMPFPTPLFDASGELTGAVNTLVDISHQKRAQDRQQLLIHELNHRVKNSLATALSIADQSLRGAASPEAFRETFTQRLLALSRAHDILTAESWEGSDLEPLLRTILAPFGGQGAERIVLTGPRVTLPPRAVLGLAMALHELATNAAKYGALSASEGALEIEWGLAETGPPSVRLSWRERNGPPVRQPERRGFGLRLLERILKAELGGDARLMFEPAGLRCEVDLPLTVDR